MDRDPIEDLIATAFIPDPPTVGALTDVNQGRGVFSTVVRAELHWDGEAPNTGERPSSVVGKLPVDDRNGAAARSSGAYGREALAYERLLGRSSVQTPIVYHVDRPNRDTCRLLLEDLGRHRAVDQLIGLSPEDVAAVVDELARFHRGWRIKTQELAKLPVRRQTIGLLDPEALMAGLAALETDWSDAVSDDQRQTFARLVAVRSGLVSAYDATDDVTLCHGDPRADNLVFADDGRPVLFDWQQMAVQFGEADLAWLAATSLDVEVRRRLDDAVVTSYGGSQDRYRLGMALPGLAVLLLAQRRLDSERTRRFVAVSLRRIATALADLDVASLAV